MVDCQYESTRTIFHALIYWTCDSCCHSTVKQLNIPLQGIVLS